MSELYRAGRFAIPILYIDNHLLIAVKPPNMPVQADASGDTDLLTALKGYVKRAYDKPGEAYLGLVHRLDRPVGGVMAFARTSKAAARLSADFAAHRIDKRYLAVLQGETGALLHLVDFLRKDEKTGMVRVVCEDEPGAKRAELFSRPVAARNGLTLTEVELTTGRAHQIRVQHAHAGFPLWGDARYGDGQPGRQIALWAYRLTVPHPTKKEPMTFWSMPEQTGAWAEFIHETETIHG